MRHSTRSTASSLAALAIAGSLSLITLATAQVRYELVVPEVLGNPVNRVSAKSNEINENGETLLNRVSTFAVWKDGAITHIASGLSDYPGTFSSLNASSINRFQQVVGSKTYLQRNAESASTEEFPTYNPENTHFDTFPFYWDPSNGIVDLDELGNRSESGGGTTLLYEINENGLALGTTLRFEGNLAAGNQAFTWSFESGRSDIEPLDAIDGYSVTTPQGLNAQGTVVGTYRKFAASTESYHERAFFFDPATGSQDLAEVDAEFFSGDHYTARDINDAGALVGERDQIAYFYDLERKEGYAIASANGSARATKAHALNDLDVVAGTADNSGQNGFSPFVWTRSTGAVDLLPHIENRLRGLLPEGIDPAACKITPKAINNGALISASLETSTTFSREIILQPVLDFRWASKRLTSENGVEGVLYVHDKTQLGETIPAAALGYSIAFECSSDMANWNAISAENDGIRHTETETSIELFLPFSDCLFVRPVLKSLASDLDAAL
ncbi:DUF3466 family protein [Pelagicoccus sp. SDUM812005]|uniref:DUF3466 family protein n=1 Tax=Pelagicoccus sp. SDUM812005 TaxID=3041257 RepID=UPI00280CF567|nr:DUF3466 family protein [Pelagicoccus sp. SDUM812005]MDQ8180218.1 DUF3466 family protein [Pelagicoccus sp. SDUM812005]